MERLTTQQKHPWRATLRTGLSVLLGAATAVPAVVQIVDEQLHGWELLGLGGQVIAVSAIVTRVMALPAADRMLEFVGLGSAPEADRGDHAA